MKLRWLITAAACLLLTAPAVYGQDAKPAKKSKKDPVLLDFPGNGQVKKSEFEYIYQKNNGGWDAVKSHTQDQYREYLNLYVNFKRKVMEAEKLGLADTPEFKSEFEGYRKQLAQPYLVEKDAQEELLKEAWERSRELVSCSHILITCAPEANPADTLKAYNRAIALRDSVLKFGKNFGTLAEMYSEDPSAKNNKGYLGYFSAFDMVYPFETGAYKTPKGSVSMPVRSGYGYHIIQVDDRVASKGKQTAAHIIIRVGPQYSAKNDDQARTKINEIYAKLKAGEDFAALAEKYSDDPTTAKKGGDLGSGRLIPEMENLKRKLDVGQISEPFQTAYGWHVLKITSAEPLKTFDESKAELKSRMNRDARSFISRERLVARVKKDNNFQYFAEAEKKLNAAITNEAEYSKGFWKPADSLHSGLYNIAVYTIGKGSGEHTGTLKDYMDWYVRARKGYEASVEQVTAKNMQLFIEDEMLKYEETQLPGKYPEYRELLKEYRDGILLFTLTETRVWRKAVEDTVGLRKYYDDHKNDFRADERVEVTEYLSEDRAAMESVMRYLEKGYTEAQIDSVLNKESSLNLRIRTQTYEKGKSERESMMFGKSAGYNSGIQEYGKSFRVLVLKKNIPAGLKTFTEAKSECITQYQNQLEKDWLTELENKYPVKVNEKVLSKLYK